MFVFGGRGSSIFNDVWEFQISKDGPTISSIVARDPDNGDAVYGANDEILITFDEPTNTPGGNGTLTRTVVNSFLSFSQNLGTDYDGQWISTSQIVISIVNPAGSDPPQIDVLTISTIGTLLRDDEEVSLPSNSVSPPLSGNWGTYPGPAVVSLVASDPDDGDAIYSIEDTITLVFSEATNRPGGGEVLSKIVVDSFFSFSKDLESNYSAVWTSDTHLVVTIHSISGLIPPAIGELTVTVLLEANLLNKMETSLPSISTSPPLQGNWGERPGPAILSIVASDPSNGDAVFGNGDEILVTFSEPTNSPAVSTRAELNILFDFSHPLGTNYIGTWEDSSTLIITIVDSSGALPPPRIGVFQITVRPQGNLLNGEETSLPSQSTSPPLEGNWGTLPGPSIVKIVASDPDDQDSFFSNDDTLSIYFDEETNTPGGQSLTKTDLDALFEFSQPLGSNYAGAWINGTTLRITILDSGLSSPEVGVLVVSTRNPGIYNSNANSLPSNSTSPPLEGNWGMLAGPKITSLTASDPQNSDAQFGNGDQITVVFDVPTNIPSETDYSTSQLNALFQFSHSIGTSYTGEWQTSSILVITIQNAGGASPEIGVLTFTVRTSANLRNAPLTSLPSDSTSPPIIGSWGDRPGPVIISFVAADPQDDDAIFNKDDILTITFNEATNQPTVSTKANLMSLFSFSEPLANDFTGRWQNPATLVITIVDATGGNPKIGEFTVTVIGTSLRSATSSLPSNSTSPPLSGNWGTLAGPSIVQFVAADPDNMDAIYSVGDTVTIVFSESTNLPSVLSKEDIDSYFSFSNSIGQSYAGEVNGPTVTISIVTTASSPPTIGNTVVQVVGNLQNAGETSLFSRSVSSPLTGNWGTLAGPDIVSLIASDPENDDAIYSNGDTITVTFSEPTNQPPVGNKGAIDGLFLFSQSLGNDYRGEWTGSQLVITIFNVFGASPPKVGELEVTVIGNVRNAAQTSLPSTSTSPKLTGNWGTLAGPSITSIVASDPDDRDNVFSAEDIITVTFNIPTSQPPVHTKELLDNLLSFQSSLGQDYSGVWETPQRLIITIINPTGGSPTIDLFFLSVKETGNLLNQLKTSLPSTATSPLLTGNWGLGPWCQYSDCNSCVANSTCGWCAERKECLEGGIDGPRDSSCVAWQKSACQECAFSSCTSCSAVTECGWCRSGSQCHIGSSSEPISGASCGDWQWKTCPVLQLNVSGSLPATTEDGLAQAFSIFLDTPPTMPVRVFIQSSDPTEGIVNPKEVIFTSSNYLTPVEIVVTGVDDDVDDGTVSYFIEFPPMESDDDNYRGIVSPSLSVVNLDNDVSGLQVSPLHEDVIEGGEVTFSFRLNSRPFQAVTLSFTLNDTSRCQMSVGSIAFPPSEWNTLKNLTVIAEQNFIQEGDALCAVSVSISSTDSLYNSLSAPTLFVGVEDDDVAGISVSEPSSLFTGEDGSSVTFTVSLTCEPLSNVVLGISSSDESEGTVFPRSLSFSPQNWYNAQTVTVTGVDDDEIDGDVSYSILFTSSVSSDPLYHSISLADINLRNLDNDSPQITVWQIGNETTESGGTALCMVVLATRPTGSVTVPVTSGDPSEGIPLVDTLVFETTTWNLPQTVVIQGVDDDVADGLVEYHVFVGPAQSDDADYHNLAATPPALAFQNVDNDRAEIQLSANGTSTTESGGSLAVTLRLGSQPLNTVQLPLSVSPVVATLSVTSLTVTVSQWEAPQTFYLYGIDDWLATGDTSYQLLVGPALSTDSQYNNQVSSLDLTNVDNDVAELVLSPLEGVTSENGSSVVFSLSLAAQPTATVVIPLESSNLLEGIVSVTQLTFTSTNWNVSQTFSVRGVNDWEADGDVSYTVTVGPPQSSDLIFAALSPLAVQLVNLDDDIVGVTTDPLEGITTEWGTSQTFAVQLTSRPLAEVTLSVASSNLDEGILSSEDPLVFTSSSWNISQSIVVVGVDDPVTDDDVRYKVIFGPAESSDSQYNKHLHEVWLTNLNDDFPGFVIEMSGNQTGEDGTAVTLTLALTTPPTASVTVPFRSSNVGEGIPSPSQLTFSQVNWNVSQSIQIVGVDDDIDDGDIEYVISIGPSLTDDPMYSVFERHVSLVNLNDDVSELILSPVSGPLTESGGEASFTVALSIVPSGTVTVTITSMDPSEVTVTPVTLTFTPSSYLVPQRVTLRGVADQVADGAMTTSIVLEASGPDAFDHVTRTLTAITLDANEAALRVSYSGTTIPEESSATGTVQLTSRPLAAVTVELNVFGESIEVTPSSLNFLPDTWQTPQVFTVTALRDRRVTGSVGNLFLVGPSHSNDVKYDKLAADPVEFLILDNDEAGISVTASGRWTSESGTSVTVACSLLSQPHSAVDFPLTLSDTTEISSSATTLRFDSSTWNAAQTITLQGVDDSEVDGIQWVEFRGGPSRSADSHFDGLTFSLWIGNLDNDDTALWQFSPTGNVSEAGVTVDTWIALTSRPTETLFLNVSVNATSECQVNVSQVSFTPSSWEPKPLQLRGLPDWIVDRDQPVVLQVTSLPSTPLGPFSSLLLWNVDIDDADLAIEPLTVTADDTLIEMRIYLTSRPTAPVTVPLVLHGGVVTPSTVTFTPPLWDPNSPQWNASALSVTVQLKLPTTFLAGEILLTAGPTTSADVHFHQLERQWALPVQLFAWPLFQSLTPQVAPLTGTIHLLRGDSLGTSLQLWVNDIPVETLMVLPSFPNTLQAMGEIATRETTREMTTREAKGETVVLFRSPPQNKTGYANLRAKNSDGGWTVQETFYYAQNCAVEGQVSTLEGCQSCPTGAECPGGDRMWPLEGYWTFDELAGEVWECQPQRRCQGGRHSPCAEGYEGLFCGRCASGYYRLLNDCGDCTAWSVGVVGAVAVILILGLLAAVVLLTDQQLAHAVWAVLALQLTALVGIMGPAQLPRVLREFYSGWALWMGDVAALRTGCLWGSASWEWTFGAQWSLAIGLGIALPTAQLVYARLTAAEGQTARALRSVTSVTLLVWPVLLRRAVEGVACVARGAGEWRVTVALVEPAVKCYAASHWAVAVMAWPAAVALAVFPLAALAALRRFERRLDLQLLAEPLGVIYLPLQYSSLFFAPLVWLAVVVLTIVQVLLANLWSVQGTVTAAVLLFLAVCVSIRNPFWHRSETILWLITLGVAGYGVALNALASSERVGEWPLLAFSVLMIIALLGLVVAYGYFLFLNRWDHSKEAEVIPPVDQYRSKAYSEYSGKTPRKQQEIVDLAYDLDVSRRSRPVSSNHSWSPGESFPNQSLPPSRNTFMDHNSLWDGESERSERDSDDTFYEPPESTTPFQSPPMTPMSPMAHTRNGSPKRRRDTPHNQRRKSREKDSPEGSESSSQVRGSPQLQSSSLSVGSAYFSRKL